MLVTHKVGGYACNIQGENIWTMFLISENWIMLIKYRNHLLLFVLCTIVILSSCTNTGKANTTETFKQLPNKEAGDKTFTTCPKPRPQICTREYNPVCGQLQNGTVKTYATGCTACSDPAVTGYITGACR